MIGKFIQMTTIHFINKNYKCTPNCIATKANGVKYF